MRAALVALVIAGCSNASPATTDASFIPIDVGIDAPPVVLHLLQVNEVAAGETPDWFEVVNLTNAPIELSDYCFVDSKGDFVKAKTFPQMTLAPGAYYAQDVDDTAAGFKLGSDEELWVYRLYDHMLSDGVDWNAGDSPMGMSFARRPDKTGAFTTTSPSRGLPNP